MFIRVLDVETTGLQPSEAGVCELAFCDVRRTATAWEVVGGQTRLVDPGHPIPPEASAIHHIIDEDVAEQPSLAEVCARLFPPGLDDEDELVALAAHNTRFDRLWLTDELVGFRRWIDTYRCALWLWPEAPAHSAHALRYWLRPAGLDREVAARHRAYGDAYVTAHLLREMLSLTTGKQLVAWSSVPAPLPRFTFGKHAMKPIAEVDRSYLQWVLGQEFDEDVLFTARRELDRREACEREVA